MNKLILILGLILATTLALPQKQSETPSTLQWKDIKKQDNWARVFLKFAELKNLSGGTLDTLIQGIEEIIEDLQQKTVRAQTEYQERSNFHDSEVKRLGDEITSAELDIADTTEYLEGILYVQRGELEQAIANIEEELEKNAEYIESEKAKRVRQNKEYIEKLNEHADALAAIEQCQGLLDQLLGEEGQLSLAQVSHAKQQFERLRERMGKNADSELVQVLVELATTEFADREMTQKVKNLLADVASNLTASVAQAKKEEQEAQEAHDEDMDNKKSENNSLILQKTENNAQLTRTNEMISNAEQKRADRTQDLADFKQDLEDENTSFQTATDNFNNLIDQINKEITACETALELIENYEAPEYIENRLDMDNVVDQGNTEISNPGEEVVSLD